MTRRLTLILTCAAMIALAALALGWLGVAFCHPAALPGDEAWHRRFLLAEAWHGLTGAMPACWTDDPRGLFTLAVARLLPGAMALFLATVVLWEMFGWRLRLALLAWRGGHVVLAGPADLVAASARSAGGPRLFLIATEAERAAHHVRNPWRHVLRIDASTTPGPVLARRLGLGRARRVLALGSNDLWNLYLAEAALAADPAAQVNLRIENPLLRKLAEDRIGGRAGLTLLSLSRVQQREGLTRAMPGRYRIEGARRNHILLCGGGEGFEALFRMIARQGYGLESAPPRLTLVHLGDPATGAHLQGLIPPDCAEVVLVQTDLAETEALDEAIAVAASAEPPVAIHCWEGSGAAALLAERCEAALGLLDLPVPPIVAHAPGEGTGRSGMLRFNPPLDPETAAQVIARQDLRARALHAAWAAAQAGQRDGTFGSLPSERDWAGLPERLREDNRASADHLAWKLALLRRCTLPGLDGPPLAPDEIARLAPVEHARWVAARREAGWRPGPRDDWRKLHPDLVPFNDLDPIARDKDAMAVAVIFGALALTDESAWCESPMEVRPPPSRPLAPGHLPVLRLPASALDEAEAALASGLQLELVLPPLLPAGIDRPRIAAILARAWRVTITEAAETTAAGGESEVAT